MQTVLVYYYLVHQYSRLLSARDPHIMVGSRWISIHHISILRFTWSFFDTKGPLPCKIAALAKWHSLLSQDHILQAALASQHILAIDPECLFCQNKTLKQLFCPERKPIDHLLVFFCDENLYREPLLTFTVVLLTNDQEKFHFSINCGCFFWAVCQLCSPSTQSQSQSPWKVKHHECIPSLYCWF